MRTNPRPKIPTATPAARGLFSSSQTCPFQQSRGARRDRKENLCVVVVKITRWSSAQMGIGGATPAAAGPLDAGGNHAYRIQWPRRPLDCRFSGEPCGMANSAVYPYPPRGNQGIPKAYAVTSVEISFHTSLKRRLHFRHIRICLFLLAGITPL